MTNHVVEVYFLRVRGMNMKKTALILILLCLSFLCACSKDEDTTTANRVSMQSYEFQTSAPTVTMAATTTTMPVVGNTVGTQVFYAGTNIWSDFDDVQRYDNTAMDATVSKTDITVFNYPLQTVLAYFSEIAFADEGDSGVSVTRKWLKPIYYEIYGSADEVDVAAIRWIAETLNGINGFPGMFTATETNKANAKFYFGNTTYMQSALGITDNTIQSCTRLYYDVKDYRIQLAKVGFATDTTSRQSRNSLILEEVLQMVGLNQNSLNYPQSLFYKANSLPQVPDELDLALVKLLYSPVIEPGMNKADGVTAAAEILVTRYESGVVYSEPEVDFAMLALEYAITTVTEEPTSEEEPTEDEDPTEDTGDYDDDPTEDEPEEDDPTEEEPIEDESTTEPDRPTIPIVIPTIPIEDNTTAGADNPPDNPTEAPTNRPNNNSPTTPSNGPTLPQIDI